MTEHDCEPQKKKKKLFFLPFIQRQHHLVCNDGLQHRPNGHVHYGYVMEFQSETVSRLVKYWRRACNGQEMSGAPAKRLVSGFGF